WFFLAIEGAAMAAEETKNPTRTFPIAYIAGILTLVFLAFGTDREFRGASPAIGREIGKREDRRDDTHKDKQFGNRQNGDEEFE
ncbi:hypothetical protein AB9F35_35120, partial [Rhizobium leguminosarum]|uniref:hypothetical protein n=1 Tax=Rhizobium leguminosarum TaxID=384 RepID=UPI003F9ADF6D